MYRISPKKKSSVHGSTSNNHPPVAPKPKPKPRRMKSSQIFQAGLPDTEGKSLGTHVCYMRQKELLDKQQHSNNHSLPDSRVSLPLSAATSELPGETEDRSSNSPPHVAPPPPPSSTIPDCPDDPTISSNSPTNHNDSNGEHTILDQQGPFTRQKSSKNPPPPMKRAKSLMNRRSINSLLCVPTVSPPIAISAPLLQTDSVAEKRALWSNSGSSTRDSIFSTKDSIQIDEGLEPPPDTPVERKKKIAMELLETEERYVERLELLNVRFRDVINRGNEQQDKPVLSELAVKQIFSNVHQIHQLNMTLLDQLRDRLKDWDEEQRLGDIMIRIAPFLKLYSDYVANFDAANSVLNDCLSKEKRFAALVQEFEKDPVCENLKISHFMLEPVQRLTRYKLLFEDYLKRLPEDALDRKETENALKIISEAANHANSKIKNMENFNELLCIQRSLTDYSGDLIQPHRVFIKRGSLGKVSRRSLQQRMFFLFSDVLLHTLPFGLFNKVRDEMELYSMSIEEPVIQPFPNSFNIFSVSRSLTVSASSVEEKEDWIRALRNAIGRIKENRDSRKKFSSSASTAGEGSICEEPDEKLSFGLKAPLWLQDNSVSMCQDCAETFSMMRRRHHCRGCGQIICAGCSKQRVFLPYLNREDRVCNRCVARYKVAGMVADERRSSELDPIDLTECNLEKSVDNTEDKDLADTLVDDTVYQGYVKLRVKWNFEKKWMLLKRDFNLYIFNAHEDIKPTHTLDLPSYSLTTSEDEKDKFKFKLSMEGTHSPDSVSPRDTVEIRPDNEEEYDTWFSLITKAINREPHANC
ncbi:FYVE, RhoGEF and PH domain-containing protein 6-like [Oopsacas minuta]|uniref:FYVE, RhoGEF and PH domain-containing protein 6-like n=1 Tax=Oopsacas minuta TaxID=111878 RepID=A0AAV7JKS4_9METZ|nr:FYVE, RhoGEF and PH domain-containing protein 6-like [Oopsacas minuta]